MSLPLYIQPTGESDSNLPQPGEPQSGSFSAFGHAVVQSLAEGPTNALLSKAEDQAAEELYPDAHVPYESVPAPLKNLFPNGGNRAVIALHERKLDAMAERQDRMANTPDSVFKSAATFTGGLVGGFLDPITAAVSVALPEAGAALGRVGFIAKAAEKAKGFLPAPAITAVSKQLEGAAGGAIIGTPMSVGSYQYQRDIGEQPDADSILTGVLENAGLGAGIGTLAGFFRAWHPATDAQIKTTALNQVNADKQVQVSPIMQQGLYESVSSAVKEGTINPELLRESSQKLSEGIGKIDQSIKEMPETEVNPLNGLSRLNKALDILKKDPIDNTTVDNARLSEMQELDYFNSIIDAASTNPAERTQAQHKIFSDFVTNPSIEKELLDHELEGYREQHLEAQKQTEAINAKLYENKSITPAEFQKLNENTERLLLLENKIKSYEARRLELRDSPNTHLDTNRLERTKLGRHQLERLKHAHDVVLDAIDNAKPVDVATLQQHFNNIQSIEGDAFASKYDEDLVRDILNKSQKAAAEQAEASGEFKAQAEQLRSEGKIPEDVYREHEDLSRLEEEGHKNLKGILDKVINCLRGT